MAEPDEEYKRRVWHYLEKMKPDQAVKIETIAEDATREKFIDAVKEYMAGLPWQGWLSFNADYTSIYKIHPIKFK